MVCVSGHTKKAACHSDNENMPITDGTFKTIEHQQVIEAWVNTCRALPNLISAVKACSDIMVSDYRGNGPHDTFWFKAVHDKLLSTRQQAASAIYSEMHNLRSKEGNQSISWGAEMSSSNKPPSKHQEAVAVANHMEVYMDGPGGHQPQLLSQTSG